MDNCQNFAFRTVKISLFKLSKFPFPNCQNFAFRTVKISLSKLSKFLFPNCQKFPFSNCQNFPQISVKFARHMKIRKAFNTKNIGAKYSPFSFSSGCIQRMIFLEFFSLIFYKFQKNVEEKHNIFLSINCSFCIILIQQSFFSLYILLELYFKLSLDNVQLI